MGLLDRNNGATLDKHAIATAYGSKHSGDDDVVFDKVDQLEKVASHLLPDERIEAVYDGAGILSGYIGITTKRLIVAHRKDVTSFPYSRISGIKADGGWFGSKLVVYVSGHDAVEVQLHDGKKALHAHDLMLQHIL